MRTIIFDWKRTLYDPDSKELINDALELLNYLDEANYTLILIGKGSTNMNDEVNRLNVGKFFKIIIFQEGDKKEEMYKPYIDLNNPRNTVIIGDRTRSEIMIGNNLGATTIWVKQGKFKDENPLNKNQTPTFTVESLSSINSIL